MSTPITRHFLTHRVSRPALRDPFRYGIHQVRAIVAHWTANTGRGANALANRNYFNMGSRYASAHYCVDDHSIVQCLPDNEVAYHVGATQYRKAGLDLMEGTRLGPNFWTIGFEMCVNSDGDWQKTYENSIWLAAWLLHKHKPPGMTLLRHYDITGKDCPKMLLDPAAWDKFNREVYEAREELQRQTLETGRCITTNLNVRTGPGMEYDVRGQLYAGEPVTVLDISGNWRMVEPGGWVHSNHLQLSLVNPT